MFAVLLNVRESNDNGVPAPAGPLHAPATNSPVAAAPPMFQECRDALMIPMKETERCCLARKATPMKLSSSTLFTNRGQILSAAAKALPSDSAATRTLVTLPTNGEPTPQQGRYRNQVGRNPNWEAVLAQAVGNENAASFILVRII
ncbi:hypothetical protein VTN96DRAFT_2770 [Rasamsonia emersonii]